MAVSTIDALYNGTSEKLTTSATGITVTGTVAATAYTGDGSALTGVGSPSIDDNGDATAMTITSAEKIGIGTASPNATLTVSQSANNIFAVERTGVSSGSGQFGINIEGNSQTTVSYDDGAPLVFGTASSPSTHTGFTERMKLDSSGRVTKPAQPYFCVHSPGQSNITVGGYTSITLNQEEVDTGGNFANNAFTAPVTGVYSLTLLVRFDDVMANSSYYNTSINTSNRSYPLLFSPNGFDANVNYWQFTINVIADMDAGDTASCNVGQIGGSSGTDINNSTRFMGYLLG